ELLAAPRPADSFNVLPHDKHLRDLRLEVIDVAFLELVRAQVDPFERATGRNPQHAHPHRVVSNRNGAKHTRRSQDLGWVVLFGLKQPLNPQSRYRRYS